jgi:hypothetical protein
MNQSRGSRQWAWALEPEDRALADKTGRAKNRQRHDQLTNQDGTGEGVQDGVQDEAQDAVEGDAVQEEDTD